MAGNNRLFDLTHRQRGPDIGGEFVFIKNGVPTTGTLGDVGYDRATIAINTACTTGANVLYYNEGTRANPVWRNAIGES